MKKPGFWRVAAAYGIDILILFVFNAYVFSTIHINSLVLFPIVLLVNILYFRLFVKQDRSIGKKLMGLQVVQAAPQKQEETK